MRLRKRTAALTGLAAACSVAIVVAATGSAWSNDAPDLSNVATANTKSVGYAPASKLSAELRQIGGRPGLDEGREPEHGGLLLRLRQRHAQRGRPAAHGRLDRRAGTPRPTRPSRTRTPTSSSTRVCRAPTRPTTTATHFLFQGHESGSPGYITRINLDADAAHRVTVLATKDDDRRRDRDIDGSTWDPWAQRLLFTTENANAPTYSATPGYPSTGRRTSPARSAAAATRASRTTRTGTSGSSRTSAARTSRARRRRSRTASSTATSRRSRGDLANGKLQVLQVLNASSEPITQASQTPLNSPDQVALHTYGSVLQHASGSRSTTRPSDGNAPFNANRSRRPTNGTPFKRPENGALPARTGSSREFFFDETGDTERDQPRERLLRRLDVGLQADADRTRRPNTGKLTLFYKGDQAHAGFDNVAFLSKNLITFVEDAGDRLHTPAERARLRLRARRDDGLLEAVRTSRCAGSPRAATPRRRSTPTTAASGRTRATTRSPGIHVSDGDHVQGTGSSAPKVPAARSSDGWRWSSTRSSTATTRPTR